jgi:hypothetical protein
MPMKLGADHSFRGKQFDSNADQADADADEENSQTKWGFSALNGFRVMTSAE